MVSQSWIWYTLYFDIIFFLFSPDQGTTGEMVDFYVVQTPSDGQSQGNSSPQTGASTPTSGVHSSVTGRTTHMVGCNSLIGFFFWLESGLGLARLLLRKTTMIFR